MADGKFKDDPLYAGYSGTSPYKQMQVVVDLPAPISREIGRAISAFALLEHALSVTTYLLLNIDRREGRLAVREPRATDRMTIIRDLLELHGLTLNTNLSDLYATIELVQTQRDALAHGVWIYGRNNTIKLGFSRGSWQPNPGQRGKVKRSMMPQAAPYDVDQCRELTATIKQAFRAVAALDAEIAAARQASRGKSRSQHPPRNPVRSQSAKAPPARPGSSQA